MRSGFWFSIIAAIVLCAYGTVFGALVGHWAFDESNGSFAMDSSGYNRNGTLYNMDDSDWVTGISGTALDFDGINDHVQIAHNAGLNINTNSWSTSFWMKSATASQGTQIVSKRASAAPYAQYSIGLSAGNSYTWTPGSRVTFLFREATGIEKGGYTTSDIDFSEWTHVCVVLNRTAGTVYVYVNGVPMAVTLDHNGTMPAISNSEPLYIGGVPGVLNHYQGQIDDVRIYNTALSGPEVSGLYNEKIIEISTPEELIAIGSDPAMLTKHFILTNDIVFDPDNNPTHVFTEALIAPYGTYASPDAGPAFRGHFDGNNHQIVNLKIEGGDYNIGLFGGLIGTNSDEVLVSIPSSPGKDARGPWRGGLTIVKLSTAMSSAASSVMLTDIIWAAWSEQTFIRSLINAPRRPKSVVTPRLGVWLVH
jgi:hypothetical protein